MKTDSGNKFLHHLNILIWKAYVQRQRRWRWLALECAAGSLLFICVCFIAKPVFLTPLQMVPEPPLTLDQILRSLPNDTILGYQPSHSLTDPIMERAAELLKVKPMIAAETSQELDEHLYEIFKGKTIRNKVIWVHLNIQQGKVHMFDIRSTVESRLKNVENSPRLTTGFLAVQAAVSQALLEHTVPNIPMFQLTLEAMPGSPLMDKMQVERVISLILMCFTLALLLPVLETEALIVTETESRLKRALRLRRVGYAVIYFGWFSFAIMTALPMVFLGAVAMILIFRWVFILTALFTLMTYTCVMITMSMIMAMYHQKAWVACTWTTLNTILLTFLAELLVHHDYSSMGEVPSFILNVLVPPLGLVHSFNQFALLQTGSNYDYIPVSGTILCWWFLIILNFLLLMLLQRTIGDGRAIGGQKTWKSIIFKGATERRRVKPVESLTGQERDNLQPVDEFVAKAISFRNVSKDIMGLPLLSNVTFDIYRCEFSMLFSEVNQKAMMHCLEDLITGLTFADNGTVHVLGEEMKPGTRNPLNMPYMMGYCDQSTFLMEDLTVQEHLTMFMDICLWHASEHYVMQYSELRFKRLLKECDLEKIQHVHVKDLDYYYRAQLCWALAILMEPKVIIMANFVDHPIYMAVMTDKIIRYKEFVAIVKMSYSNIQLVNADRVYVFDYQKLSFGGTPAYMFYKYGREYRLRLTLRSASAVDDEAVRELLMHAAAAGAAVRSHMGCILILRIPTSPTIAVAEFVKELEDKFKDYNISSMKLTLPDSDEIFQRSLYESRPAEQMVTNQETNDALIRLAERKAWKLQKTMFCKMTHFRIMIWKYYSHCRDYKSSVAINIMTAIFAGIIIGGSMAFLLKDLIHHRTHVLRHFREVLTVESLMATTDTRTTLVLRVEDSKDALDLARGYVLSEARSSQKEVKKMTYLALPASESLTEYLVTKAIDSPENYVYLYAYGLDVATDSQGNFVLKVLYSPMHNDYSAGARSLARAYMALLRFYSKALDASIVVYDYPLVIGLAPWIKAASTPPLLVQFILVMALSHATLLPSHEYGLIRHFQCHAQNFSPTRYWLSLFFCDLVYYLLLVLIICLGIAGIILFSLHADYVTLSDLLSLPLMLVLYGMAAIPQAYLFSLGPRPALNAVAFAIINIVFGEATIVTKLLLYGGIEDSTLDFMVISPQYNMAYAFVKIRSTLLYNSECIIYRRENLCYSQILHMCCEKCSVLQPCFKKKPYLYIIRNELIGCGACCVVFTLLLLLWEYRIIQNVWLHMLNPFQKHETGNTMVPGLRTLKRTKVLGKERQIKLERHSYTYNHDRGVTFGEHLLAVDVSYKKHNIYLVRDVCMGLGRGEILGLSGLKRHGRLKLCELLAGFEIPSGGRLWAMSKYGLNTESHKYRCNVTICCERNPLPGWMSMFDALRLVAILRGVPVEHVSRELHDIIEALDLTKQMHKKVLELPLSIRMRLHFAAAVVGAPPVIVLDECTAYQPYSVRRAMYHIIYCLHKRGHSIFISDSHIESHLPVTNRLAILLDGQIRDMDCEDQLVDYYSDRGYTVVMHLKDELDVEEMASQYFNQFVIKDMSEVLVNMQVLDLLKWSEIFQKMEQLKSENTKVYSYIVCSVPIAYVYNSTLDKESGLQSTSQAKWTMWFKSMPKVTHTEEQAAKLKKFQKRYDINTLGELPWSVIFQT